VTRAEAQAKVNLALVVGPVRPDGKHEVATVLQAVDLADTIALEPAERLEVTGYAGDTIVRRGLEALAASAGAEPRWRVTIVKRIPVAAGLGGGSSDAAAALRLANATLPEPLSPRSLQGLAAELGADVPFFLEPGPKLATGDGTSLAPLELPRDYAVLLALPDGEEKESTGAVYEEFDARRGADGFAVRRARLDAALANLREAGDLARLPGNDLASSPLAGRLRELGAFRADASGAGPAVYGLFARRADAERAQARLGRAARTWIAAPSWYV
jgi:4-diphosphocytidyl-2-C-methyl-D-erythritol kinase